VIVAVIDGFDYKSFTAAPLGSCVLRWRRLTHLPGVIIPLKVLEATVLFFVHCYAIASPCKSSLYQQVSFLVEEKE
jgi:hypothetical protein